MIKTILSNNITSVPINNSTTSSYTLASTGASWVNNTVNPVFTVNKNHMTVDQQSTIDVKGKMVLNGQDLEERLKTIEEVLHIPERDVILEQKHPKLKKMYDDYIRALKKYRTWETLKGEE